MRISFTAPSVMRPLCWSRFCTILTREPGRIPDLCRPSRSVFMDFPEKKARKEQYQDDGECPAALLPGRSALSV
ncbi:hypothetical protein ASZ90_015881 [hydrocarbon metagenome]|uniref:Uncharacterized protein n=1 Tax=hydrocarbon metagenome TaxID=938273 RepID=A0A0W8F282_9ZZZZ